MQESDGLASLSSFIVIQVSFLTLRVTQEPGSTTLKVGRASDSKPRVVSHCIARWGRWVIPVRSLSKFTLQPTVLKRKLEALKDREKEKEREKELGEVEKKLRRSTGFLKRQYASQASLVRFDREFDMSENVPHCDATTEVVIHNSMTESQWTPINFKMPPSAVCSDEV